MRRLTWVLAVMVASLGLATSVHAAEADTEIDTEIDTGADAQGQPSREPLMAVPAGCDAPELPAVVFEGQVVQSDFRTVRWEIVEVRAGDPAAFVRGQQVDVRFGLDGQFLEPGANYLVAARRDPFLGVLVSRVAPPNEVFGGADVVGLAPAAPECPLVADPALTVNVDGSPVPTAVLSTLTSQPRQLLAAALLPAGVVVLVVFLLALARLTLASVSRAPR